MSTSKWKNYLEHHKSNSFWNGIADSISNAEAARLLGEKRYLETAEDGRVYSGIDFEGKARMKQARDEFGENAKWALVIITNGSGYLYFFSSFDDASKAFKALESEAMKPYYDTECLYIHDRYGVIWHGRIFTERKGQ